MKWTRDDVRNAIEGLACDKERIMTPVSDSEVHGLCKAVDDVIWACTSAASGSAVEAVR